MKAHIFREYDIRGIVGKEFEIDEVENLTKAILVYCKQHDSSLSSLVVGMDGRTHSPHIREKVISTLCRYGITVIDIGICPTPVFYFSLFQGMATSGMMITASHNPAEYNGFKLCSKQFPIYGEALQTIRSIYEEERFETLVPSLGKHSEISITERYCSFLAQQFSHLIALPMNIMIDCGNGTAGAVLPSLLSAMKWTSVDLMYETIDGAFPNHEADPTNLEAMKELSAEVESKKYELGIGFDGDCDRMAPLTHTGELVSGDKVLALFSKTLSPQHRTSPIICDIKTSEGVLSTLHTWGMNPVLAPSGHSRIKSAMVKHKAPLAGELSCHFFFADRYFGYDDGIYAFLRLLEFLTTERITLADALCYFPETIITPEIRLQCEEDQKEIIVNEVRTYFAARRDCNVITIDGVRVHTKEGWGLARVSNTQPVISLRFEAATSQGLHHLKSDFATVLQKHFSPTVLYNTMGV